MTPVSDHKVDAGFLEELLALPTLEQRSTFLRTAGLLNAEGLERLLDSADRLIHSDPGKAQRLAALCADLADLVGAPSAAPRALTSAVRHTPRTASSALRRAWPKPPTQGT